METHKCDVCGGQRFKTVRKNQQYQCRKCGAPAFAVYTQTRTGQNVRVK